MAESRINETGAHVGTLVHFEETFFFKIFEKRLRSNAFSDILNRTLSIRAKWFQLFEQTDLFIFQLKNFIISY